jgi:hypothetical protein
MQVMGVKNECGVKLVYSILGIRGQTADYDEVEDKVESDVRKRKADAHTVRPG